MKRYIVLLLLVVAGAAGLRADGPAALTRLQQVRQLDNRTAAGALRADFEATLTYFRPYEQTMFVEDGGQAMFVLATTDTPLVPGDRIRIRGTTLGGLSPYVQSNDITVVGHGTLPAPHPTTFSELISADDDCMRVVVTGRVRAAVEEVKNDVRGGNRPRQSSIRLQVLTDGGMIEALVDDADTRNLDRFVDAEVEITGIAGGKFDGKLEQTGVVIHVSALDGVKMVKGPARDPWTIPALPMEQIMRAYRVHDLSERVRVRGVVTFYQPGTAMVLQDGSKSLWVSTLMRTRTAVGEVVDAIGFPDTRSGFLRLNDAVFKERNVQETVTPQPVKWQDLAASHKVFDLVTIEGQVMTENRETGQDEYVIASENHLFTAIFRHNVLFRYPDEPLPGLKAVPPGSIVKVTGVCIPEDSNPFSGKVPFSLLLRSPGDIAIVADPPWLNVRHLVFVVGILLLVVFVAGMREWMVERKVRRKIAGMAYIEQRRSKILEDINNSRPLAEILERITELVSAALEGAPCWCQIRHGARLGNAPADGAKGLRVVEHSIPGRSGESLGTLYAAFHARTAPRPLEQQTLALAAGLATLAIETSRLYTDLVHRSEFDLLTDVQNRFSLEKFLDAQIESARKKAGVFGLLYLDLDKFKQVNDLYGHHVGDIYLQQAAARMKRQLRPGDMLARVGGDEFAVVVPSARHGGDVEEIAHRLERSFDEPFLCDGRELLGSASIGLALYPEDGATCDDLLRAADTAMYAAKNSRRALEEESVSPEA